MPSSEAPTYWLMPGETPLGPYRVEEILSQIQAGTCSWLTKASLVGSQTWAPLNQLLTLAPMAALATASATPPVKYAQPPSPQSSPPFYSTERGKFLIFAGLALSFICACWLWSAGSSNSSMSPQQVCRALFSAKNITEARKYVTPNLYAALDMLAAQPDFGSDDNEDMELTSEQPAPAQAGGGYYVGYRAHFREAGRVITYDGVFHVLNQSGNKVHDWYLFSCNGLAIEPPLSVAREYELLRDPQNPAAAGRQMTDAKRQAQQWYSNNSNLTRMAGVALFKSGVGKALLGIIGVVCVGIFGFFKNKQTSSSSPS